MTELTGISLMTDSFSIGVGDTHWLCVQQFPVSSVLPAVTCQSSDQSLATVDSNGRVTGKGAGSATITASCGNFSATCTVSVLVRTSEEYQIGALTARSSSGVVLTSIPTETFWVTVPVTKMTSGGNTLLLLASYGQNGQYKGLFYVSVENAPIGATISITLPVDNTRGDIAQLKAFTVASFSNLQPLGSSVSFSA